MLIPPKQIIITLITAPEFNLEFLGWLTIVFLILAILYFVGTFFIRNRIGTYNMRSKDKKMEFSPMISEFLFYEDSNNKEEKKNYLNLKVQIRESIKDNFDRNILTEVLLDLRKDLSGQSQIVLIELYKDLGLHNTAYEKLSSRRWQIISSGILELTAMEVLESYSLIIKFINHRQGTIRKQAEIAVVNLKEEGIAYFLDNTKYKISEWQQLKLLDVLRHKPNFDAPQFSLWLTSTNTHVVLFSLRLIKYYKQSDAKRSIITLLKHKNRDIQIEAIDCIKEFYFVDAIPTLKMVFIKANNDVKIAILDTLGEIGSMSEIYFLEILKNKEKNFNVKSKVIGTLNKINPECILPTKNIEEVEHFTTDHDEDIPIKIESTFVNQECESESVSVIQDIKETSGGLIIEEPIIATLETQVEDKESLKLIGAEIIITNEEPIPLKINNVDVIEFNKVLSDDEVAFSPNPVNDISLIMPVSIDDTEDIIIPKTDNTDQNIPIHDLNNIHETEKELFTEFLPLVLSEINCAVTTPNENANDIEFTFSLDENFEVEGNTTDNHLFDAIENDFEEIDWSSISKMEPVDIVDELIENQKPLVVIENDSVSFAANFMDETELDTMVLLENISDLGDSRELPMLHKIIATNTSLLILERTNELIHKFSYQSPRPNEMFSSENDLSSSVFTEVINLSDTETKLILLEEIKTIGDEKEIPLLKYLIENEKGAVATNANDVLTHILSQTTKEDLTEVLGIENSLFDLDFELEIEKYNTHKINSTLKGDGSTLFDQLCSMSTSLYNKING